MTLDKSPQRIQKMFNTIAFKYDFINNVMSLGTHQTIKSDCIKRLNIKPDYKVLDLCCGTGDLTSMIKKYTQNVIGIDFSDKMLEIAREKVKNTEFFQGDATALPFPDDTFDIVTIGFGLRNIQNAEKAVEEIYRVLKPNGLFMHLDFGEKNILSRIFDKTIPIFIKIFSQNSDAYSYLIKSKQEFLTPDELIKDFESKGFALKNRFDYLFKAISCQIMRKL